MPDNIAQESIIQCMFLTTKENRVILSAEKLVQPHIIILSKLSQLLKEKRILSTFWILDFRRYIDIKVTYGA